MSKRHGQTMVPRYAVIETRCDNCGRTEKGEPEGWIDIHFGHEDWDNDSVESYQDWDACSAPCTVAVLAKIAEEYQPKYREEHATLSVRLAGLNYQATKALGALKLPEELR